jgi:hypothetical protein
MGRIYGENSVGRHQKIMMAMILDQESTSFECHSGLDQACPVHDTGESSVFNLDSCFRRNDGLGTYAKKRWRHHTITFTTIFVLAGFVLMIPVAANGQAKERNALSQESGRDPFLLPPGIHLLSKTAGPPGVKAAFQKKETDRGVKAILISDHARLALIDHHIVTVGDSIYGEEVLEIKTDRVILGKGNQKRTLLLSQSPVRLTVEQSPRPYPPPEKGSEPR